MQYFILSISSLNHSFSILESGKDIKYKLLHINEGVGDLDEISKDDFILGYKRGINLISIIFKVTDVNINENEIILEKLLESNNGLLIDDSDLIERLERNEIIEIEESHFKKLLQNFLNIINSNLDFESEYEKSQFISKKFNFGLSEKFFYVLKNHIKLNKEMGRVKENPIYGCLENGLPNTIKKIINRNNFKIIGSTGSGEFPQSLSISILDEDITDSTEKGIYVVYYFEKDMKCFYLSLSVGSNQFGTNSTYQDYDINQVVNNIKSFIVDSELDYLKTINLNEELNLALDGKPNSLTKSFQKGSIICKKYEVNDENSLRDYNLIQDLNIFLKLYDYIKKNYRGDYDFLLGDAKNNSYKDDYEDILNFESLYLDFADRIFNGNNVLLYGVPGSGKSFTIENDYCDDETVTERILFHPDYTYSDFVGQILPKVREDRQIEYEFTPGPFTRILKQAYENPQQKFILIIEEINRGNAPAIFGDVFQLLDRKTSFKNKKDNGFPLGTSEYEITNYDIADNVYEDKEHPVRIPANLSIMASMNTSDQNVFTLDTAFKRRWTMRMIENSFDDVRFNDLKILNTGLLWKDFCEIINESIVENNISNLSSEDKRIGPFFVDEKDLIFDEKAINGNDDEKSKAKLHNDKFAEKVLMYLWDDALKLSREEVFDDKNLGQFTLEYIVKKFNEADEYEKFTVFNETIQQRFKNKIEENKHSLPSKSKEEPSESGVVRENEDFDEGLDTEQGHAEVVQDSENLDSQNESTEIVEGSDDD